MQPSAELSTSEADRDGQRYAAWLHELDAWTEYWDIYHPETRGRYYFGDGCGEDGLLTRFLPREKRPAPFVAWERMALQSGDTDAFASAATEPQVSTAVVEVDKLTGRLFRQYFGDAAAPGVCRDYLEAMFRCGIDSLPPAAERDRRIDANDWRKRTADRHVIDGDIMWFAWAVHLEASHVIAGFDGDHARRALQLAGVAIGCAANFAWRGHRRTRLEYKPDDATARLLRLRGVQWAADFGAAAREVHELYRIREWGDQRIV